MGLIIGFVVGHFFLFCNVFRVARPLEFAWASLFTALAGSTIVVEQPGWPVTLAISLAATLVVIVVQMHKPSYHGIAWQRINPELRAWWEAQGGGSRVSMAINAASDLSAEGKWAITARDRNCYCGVWDKDPITYESQGYPLGYCGVCERCGVPGHTRHFPGPVPYTGAWCDRCYRVVKWTWPFRSVAGWFYIFAAIAIVVAVGSSLVIAIERTLG